jgi:adenylate cyclase
MYKIISLTDNRTIRSSHDDTILEAMLKAEIRHAHVCGCKGNCSTCRVYITDGLSPCLPRTEREENVALKLGFPDHIRLACQTKINGDITIRRPVVDDLDIDII